MHLAGNVAGVGVVLAILGAGGVASRGAEATNSPPQERVEFSGTASDKLLYDESELTKPESRFDFLDRDSSMGGALPGASVGGGGATGNALLRERLRNRSAGQGGWVLGGAEEQEGASRFEEALDLWGQAARASKRSQQYADLLGEDRPKEGKVAPRRSRNTSGETLALPLSLVESGKTSTSLDPLVDVPLGTPAWERTGVRALTAESAPNVGLASPPSGLSSIPVEPERLVREASPMDALRLQKSFRDILEGSSGRGRTEEDPGWLDLQADSTREEVNPVVGNRWRVMDSASRESQADPWQRGQEKATAGEATALRRSLLEQMTDKTMGPSSLAPALPAPSVLDPGRPAPKGSSIELPTRKF